MGLKIRNRANQVSGWIIVAFSLAVMAYVDPMGALLPREGASGRGVSPNTALVTGLFWSVAVGGYLYFARPYVEVGPSCLFVRNPFAVYWIPVTSDLTTSQLSRRPTVGTPDFKVRIYALEQSNLMLFRGVSLMNKALDVADLPNLYENAPAECVARRKVSVFDPMLWALVFSFSLYLGICFLR